MQELERSYHQPHLMIETVAARIGIGREYVFRLFRRHLHQTPSKYLNMIRLREAERLLTCTHQPVHRVAAWCGFHDTSALSHAVKSAEGCTPTAFRVRQMANGGKGHP
jgi:AraC-like DNA-binding protein